MRNIAPIARRELSGYFLSPLAYIVLTIFLVVTGFFFLYYLGAMREATLQPHFGMTGIILLFVTPMITM
jgi:ABC-2 type transport system permease protein